MEYTYHTFRNNSKMCLTVHSKKSDSVIILLGGHTNSPELYFALPIYPDGSSIIDKINDNGYDVACLDAVGFGRSIGMVNEWYTRVTYAEQLTIAIEYLKNKYTKIFLHGFCSTSEVPLIAANYRSDISGILVQSPRASLEHTGCSNFLAKRNLSYPPHSSIENFLLTYRSEPLKIYMTSTQFLHLLESKSDKIVGHSLRIPGWNELRAKVLANLPAECFPNNSWPLPRDWLYDFRMFPVVYGGANRKWQIENIKCPIITITGDSEEESSHENQDIHDLYHALVQPNLLDVIVIKDATHFGMWEIAYDNWAAQFISALIALDKSNQ